MPTTTPPKKKSDLQLLLYSCLIAGFLIITAAWRAYMDYKPAPSPPVIPGSEFQLPSPNAFDFYVEAVQAYMLAVSTVDNKGVRNINLSRVKEPKTLAQKEAWLKKHAAALALVHEGSKYSCRALEPFLLAQQNRQGLRQSSPGGNSSNRSPLNRSQRSLPSSLHLYAVPHLAQLLVTESEVYAARGNWERATRSLLTLQKLGHDLMQGGIARYVSSSFRCRVLAQRELAKIYPQLDAAMAKSVVRRWEAILENRVSFADFMREEKKVMQYRLSRTLEANLTARPARDKGRFPFRFSDLWSNKHTENQNIVQEYSDYADELIAFAEAPYDSGAREPEPPQLSESHPYFMMYRFGSHYGEMRWKSLMTEIRDSLLITEIALHAHRLERKQNPQNLNYLVPEYLKKVPRDVFGKREPLRYVLSRQKYSLYSVGPDGVDDSARAIETLPYPARSISNAERYNVQSGQRGDIVMGVNVR